MTRVQIEGLVRVALPLMIAEWYSLDGNEAGGLLHTMLDDGNMTDRDCEDDRLRAGESGDPLAIAIVDAIRFLPEKDRKEAAYGDGS